VTAAKARQGRREEGCDCEGERSFATANDAHLSRKGRGEDGAPKVVEDGALRGVVESHVSEARRGAPGSCADGGSLIVDG